MYQTDKPRYLSLTAFKFPLNAKLSILHRITGVFLVLSLIKFLALIHLILLHPQVTLAAVSDHVIVLFLSSVFWITLAFHWLSGTKHLLAEHFTAEKTYNILNSDAAAYSMLTTWIVISAFILYYFWM